ncbi:MAG: hypothetical protein AAGI25_20920 [Bacteroidota bacterium]
MNKQPKFGNIEDLLSVLQSKRMLSVSSDGSNITFTFSGNKSDTRSEIVLKEVFYSSFNYFEVDNIVSCIHMKHIGQLSETFFTDYPHLGQYREEEGILMSFCSQKGFNGMALFRLGLLDLEFTKRQLNISTSDIIHTSPSSYLKGGTKSYLN